MRLRNLREQDAEKMLEWMHDQDVVRYLKKDFSKMTILDCKSFIENACNNKENIHMAVVNDNDEYMGTVSLKNIDRVKGLSEFGISMRKLAMGTGLAIKAMRQLFQFAYETEKLKKIYWCVDLRNERANCFYKKHGFSETADLDKKYLKQCGYSEEEIKMYVWYDVELFDVSIS